MQRKPSSQAGYNLLQMSLALLVIGICIGAFFSVYTLYDKSQKIKSTDENIASAINKVQDYRNITGAYPCPGPLSVDRSDPNYGHASKCQPTLAPPYPANSPNGLLPGTCGTAVGTKGLCVEQNTVGALVNPRVIIGAIPFRDLQIDEKSTFDGYGRRLVYAVTESMTDKSKFDEKNGAIDIVNATGVSQTKPAGTASFVVISPGPTGVGGYMNVGSLYAPCAGAGKDLKNCNAGFESGVSDSTTAIFVSIPISTAPGANFFDDSIDYYSQNVDPTWKRTDLEKENIEDLSPKFVGVGTSLPTTELEISSASATPATDSLRAKGTATDPGKLMTDKICDQSGTYCFKPEDITSTSTIRCPVGQYLRGIGLNGPKCLSYIEVKCPPDRPVMQGIIDHAPNCIETPGARCAATTKMGCLAGDISLPQANDQASLSFSRGSCKQVTYTCDNGTWRKTFDNGDVCVLDTTPFTVPAGFCQQGYSGQATDTYVHGCGGHDIFVSDNRATACVCTGGTFTDTEDCGSGKSYTVTKTITCNPYKETITTDQGSACACTPPAQTTKYLYGNCPNGQIRSASAPAALFAGATSNRQGIVQVQNFNASPSTCNYENSGGEQSYCSCDPSAVQADESQPHTCANPSCEEPDPSKPDIYKVTIDASCNLTKTLKTTGACRAKSFKWVSQGSDGSVASSIPSGARYVSDSCSCSDNASTMTSAKNCFLASDASKTIYSCRCQ